MTEKIRHIKIANSYIGAFDFDNDSATTPVVVAVAESLNNLPFEDAVHGGVLTHTFEDAPVYEITSIVPPVKKNGKVSVVFSNKNYVDYIISDNPQFTNHNGEIPVVDLKNSILKDYISAEEIDKLVAEHANEEPVQQEDEIVYYSIELSVQQFITFFALNLSGETYILFFGKQGKPYRQSDLIKHGHLETVIALPEPDTDEYVNILKMVGTLASENGLKGIHNIIPDDPKMAELEAQVRKEIFLTLTEIGFGSEKHLAALNNYAKKIDTFYEEVILNGRETLTADDIKTEIVISTLDHILFKSNAKSVTPHMMLPNEIIKFRNDFNEFDKLTRTLEMDEKFIQETLELEQTMSLFDMDAVKAKRNPDAITAYIVSHIDHGDLPAEMFHMDEALTNMGFFDANWGEYASFEDLTDEEIQPVSGTIGQNLVSAAIAAIVRLSRVASINGSNFLSIFSAILSEVGPEDDLWEFEAFAENISKGETATFKSFLTSTPKGSDLAETISLAPLGAALFAFVKSIVEENWNSGLLEAGISEFPAIYGFVTDCHTDITRICVELKANGEWDKLMATGGVTENQIITSMASQVVLHYLAEIEKYETDIEAISAQLIGAMLSIADINTGRMTDKAFNSTDWLSTKEKYLSGVLQMDAQKFFINKNLGK